MTISSSLSLDTSGLLFTLFDASLNFEPLQGGSLFVPESVELNLKKGLAQHPAQERSILIS